MLCLSCLCSGIPTHHLRQCVPGGGGAGGSRAPCAGLAGGGPTLPHRFTGWAPPLSCPPKHCRSLPPPSNPSLCFLEHVGWSVKGCKRWGWSHHHARTRDGARPTPTTIYLTSQPLSCTPKPYRSLPPPSRPAPRFLAHAKSVVRGRNGGEGHTTVSAPSTVLDPPPARTHPTSQPLSCTPKPYRSLPPPSRPAPRFLAHAKSVVRGRNGGEGHTTVSAPSTVLDPPPARTHPTSQSLNCTPKPCHPCPHPQSLAHASWHVLMFW